VSDIAVGSLYEALCRQPSLAVGLVKHLAARLQEARDDAARLVFDDCHQRLLKTLVRFSASAAASKHEDGVVLRITHQQLAQAVGVARETISLALTQLRQRNVLRTGRNRLTFNPQVISRLAGPCASEGGDSGADTAGEQSSDTPRGTAQVA
jgi:CRP-like cAMP-binding protein